MNAAAAEWYVEKDYKTGNQALYLGIGLGDYADFNIPKGNKIDLHPYYAKVTSYYIPKSLDDNPYVMFEKGFNKVKFKTKKDDISQRDQSFVQKDCGTKKKPKSCLYMITKTNESEASDASSATGGNRVYKSSNGKITGKFKLVNDDMFNRTNYMDVPGGKNGKPKVNGYELLEGGTSVYFQGKFFTYFDAFDQRRWVYKFCPLVQFGGQLASCGQIKYSITSDFKNVTLPQKITAPVSTRHGVVINVDDPMAKKIIWEFRNGGNKTHISVRQIGNVFDKLTNKVKVSAINYKSGNSKVIGKFSLTNSNLKTKKLKATLVDQSAKSWSFKFSNYSKAKVVAKIGKTKFLTIKVLSKKPSKPLWYRKYSASEFIITPPKSDGGSPIIYYEVKSKGKKIKFYIKNGTSKASLLVKRGVITVSTIDSVKACNKYGCSASLAL